MKNIIRLSMSLVVGLVLAGVWPRTAAAVTDEEFKTLQEQMQKQGQQIQDLQKGREEDQKEIQRLKQQVGETQATTAETQKKVEETQKTATEAAAAAAKPQPVGPVVSEEAAAQRNFYISGGMDVLYQKAEGQNGSFILNHFNPILLFRASDKVLAEGSLEMSVMDTGDTEVNLEYAQLDYLFNDYLTLIGGRFLVPLGVVREKLDPAWIDKLPLQPLPEADNTALIAENDIGVQARGAFHVCEPVTLTYALFVGNGPGTNGPSGLPSFNGGLSANGKPNGGGRLALFYPWEAHDDIELGVSGQTGPYSPDGRQSFSVFAVDAALHLSPNFEARGEFIQTWQDNDGLPTTDREGWWAQAAYKLAGLDLEWPMINNVEAVFRVGEEHQQGGHVYEYDLGLNYHITNTLIVKGAYSFFVSNLHSFVNPDGDTVDLNRNMFTLQAAYGF
jgi:hypothetical protein